MQAAGIAAGPLLSAMLPRCPSMSHPLRTTMPPELVGDSLEALADALPVALLVLSADGRVSRASPACQTLGLDPQRIAGLALVDLVAGMGREAAGSLVSRPEPARLACDVLRPDGSRLPVELTLGAATAALAGGRLVVVDDRSAGVAAEARIRFLAGHDPLTGLPNRGTFLEQAEQAFARAHHRASRMAVLFVDIDHFKRVNDSLGYAAGDAMLTTVASRITGALRTSDLVCRHAGDEFVVLLAGDPDRAAIEEVARKLLLAIEAPVQLADGSSICVTPSIGVALFPEHGREPAELLKRADTAMTHAKARGRARVLLFEPAMAEAAYDALMLESDLGDALREGQFELASQPQVRCGDGALAGLEALVRWRHPQRGWVSPEDFIELAEQRRLMLGIGRWVLDEALRQARDWQSKGLLQARVGVNLSSMQFQGTDVVAWIERALADTGAAPACLELELTERMIMDDLPDGRASLQALRRLGVHVALDDFGTGTTSLSQLKSLEVDRLKIDRSFVHDLPADPAAAAVAEAIIRLALGLGLEVVAEGVETPRQWDWLSAHGCTHVQGHLVAQPMDAAQCEAWLRQRAAGGRLRPWEPSSGAASPPG